MGETRLTFSSVSLQIGDRHDGAGSEEFVAPAEGSCLRALDNFKDEILLLNDKGIITWISVAVRDCLGDITGKPCRYLCGSRKTPTESCMVGAALAGDDTKSHITEVVAANGDSTYIETTARPLYRDNGVELYAIALVRRDITGRIWLEKGLQEISRKLTETERELEGKTSALNELLARMHQEKKEVAARIRDNVERTILPVLSQLNDRLGEHDRTYVRTLLALLDDMTSPFVDRLESRFGRLTLRELEISNLVRNGLSSKEIAALLNRSEGTVRQQRKQIRKKFGIAGDSVNLSLFLRSLGPGESQGSAKTAHKPASRRSSLHDTALD